MRKRAHLSFGQIGPVGALLLLAVVGCGDDDSPNDAGTSGKGGGGGSGGQTAGSSSAGRGGSSGATAGAGGVTGTGDLLEGDQCTATAECGPGTVCVTAAVGQQAVRVCARPCTAATEATDCGKSDAGGKGTEVCDSPYTELARDAHCINLQPDAYAYCGVGETAACDGDRACLYFPQSTIGVCVNLCAVDPTQDAGIEGLAATCSNSQACVSGVVENEAVGVCGSQVARDAECGIEKGIFCSGTDICVPDDLNADEGPQHCREDCTESSSCTSGGACTAVRNLFKYCKK
jgi:hypothetical protein